MQYIADLYGSLSEICLLPMFPSPVISMQYTHGCWVHMQRSLCHSQDRKLAREGLWAHETEVPEVGGLLLARAEAPDLNSDSRLCQLVIFLLEHGPNGSKGVIINRPARANVGDLLDWGYQPSQVSNARNNPLHVSSHAEMQQQLKAACVALSHVTT